MKGIVFIVIVGLGLLNTFSSQSQDINSIKEKFLNTEFNFEEVTGIGFEAGVTRRDPSDVIKIGQTYYVYYTKYGKEILERSHEVLIWPQGTGVGAFASLSETFEYAPDGIDFMPDKLNAKVQVRAVAPGAYRPDLTNPVVVGEGLKWGISMVPNKHECYLVRFEIVSG
jgi:hypothetical protein